jgi:transposase
VMDRGYLDFRSHRPVGARLHAFSLRLAFFVTRAKTNLRYHRVNSRPVDKTTGVRADQTIVLTGINTVEHYPDKLRRVRFFDVENRKKLVFLTNDFSLPPESIALLYKQRWQVELFFRWIKQHLRIKAFFGTSENAVKTQVWIAISVYVLVAIVKKRLHLKQSLYTILQILSISVFEKEPLFQILTNYERSGLLPEPDNQLNLFK